VRIANFEVDLQAIDHGEARERWNGGLMASREASAALHAAVEAFQNELRAHGFVIARTGYGVTAFES
jgi:hypothetical protein